MLTGDRRQSLLGPEPSLLPSATFQGVLQPACAILSAPSVAFFEAVQTFERSEEGGDLGRRLGANGAPIHNLRDSHRINAPVFPPRSPFPPTQFYGGRPAADQASARGSASAVGSPMAAQNLTALNEGSSAATSSATDFASSMRPSLASAAASRLWDTLKLGTDCRARRVHTPLCGSGRAENGR